MSCQDLFLGPTLRARATTKTSTDSNLNLNPYLNLKSKLILTLSCLSSRQDLFLVANSQCTGDNFNIYRADTVPIYDVPIN
jgi:hypothetical protein